MTEELEWDPTVTSSDLRVAVENGIVTLSGTAPHYAEKVGRRTCAKHAVRQVIETAAVDTPNVTDDQPPPPRRGASSQ